MRVVSAGPSPLLRSRTVPMKLATAPTRASPSRSAATSRADVEVFVLDAHARCNAHRPLTAIRRCGARLRIACCCAAQRARIAPACSTGRRTACGCRTGLGGHGARCRLGGGRGRLVVALGHGLGARRFGAAFTGALVTGFGAAAIGGAALATAWPQALAGVVAWGAGAAAGAHRPRRRRLGSDLRCRHGGACGLDACRGGRWRPRLAPRRARRPAVWLALPEAPRPA